MSPRLRKIGRTALALFMSTICAPETPPHRVTDNQPRCVRPGFRPCYAFIGAWSAACLSSLTSTRFKGLRLLPPVALYRITADRPLRSGGMMLKGSGSPYRSKAFGWYRSHRKTRNPKMGLALAGSCPEQLSAFKWDMGNHNHSIASAPSAIRTLRLGGGGQLSPA